MSADKREPWSKFYWADWRANKELRLCSLSARGLWMEMLCLMHEADPYGHLLINGKPPSIQQLALQVAAPLPVVRKAMQELEAAGVATVKDGVWISRRMVRDAHRRAVNRINGENGGNPKLKDKPPLNPTPPKSDKRTEDVRITDPDKASDKPHDARDPEARSQKPEELENQSRFSSGSGGTPSARPGKIAGQIGMDWSAIVTRMQSHGFDAVEAWTIVTAVGDRPDIGRRLQGAMRSAEDRGKTAYLAIRDITNEVVDPMEVPSFLRRKA